MSQSNRVNSMIPQETEVFAGMHHILERGAILPDKCGSRGAPPALI